MVYYSQMPQVHPTIAVRDPQDLYPVSYCKKMQQAMAAIIESTQPYIAQPASGSSQAYRGRSSSWTSGFSSPTYIRVGNTYNGISYFNNNTVNSFNAPANSNSQNSKKADQTSVILGIAFLAIGGCFAYLLGSSLSEKSNADRDLRNIETLKRYKTEQDYERHFKVYSDLPALEAQKGYINEVIENGEQLFAKKRSEANWNLALRVSMLGSAIIGATGAFAGAPALMVAGAVGTVACGLFMLIRAGMNSNDKERARLAKIIEDNAQAMVNVYNQLISYNAAIPVEKYTPMQAPQQPAYQPNLMASAPGYYQ